MEGSTWDAESTRGVLNNDELISIVFSFLEDMAHSGARHRERWHPPEEEAVIDELPYRLREVWKARLARLARVNRAFFHASIKVLWETMDTIKPFFTVLLKPDIVAYTGSLVQNSLSYRKGISAEQWERFRLYSSKTKNIALHRQNLININPAWLQFLSVAKGRPASLFPALKRVYLHSDDDLSMYIAFHVLPQPVFMSVKLDGYSRNEGCAALTLALSTTSHQLTSLSLGQPTTIDVISNISNISSLTHLYIWVDNRLTERHALSELDKLTSLEKLIIQQDHDPEDADAAFSLPTSVAIEDHINRESVQEHLRHLKIEANGTSQFFLAALLSPRSLNTLHLTFLVDVLGLQVTLVPVVVTLHAERNPGLTFLEIKCPEYDAQAMEDLDTLDRVRSNPGYTNMEPFLSSLSSLSYLTHLSFVGVPFFEVDIIEEMLKVMRNLPLLEAFKFIPEKMTTLAEDALVIPRLEVLEDIAVSNPRLVHLAIPLDDSIIPDIPWHSVSTHRLMLLRLSESRQRVNQVQNAVKLAGYLDRLFPHLVSASGYYAQSEDERAAWVVIEKIIFSYQEMRKRTAEDATTVTAWDPMAETRPVRVKFEY
ncbi:hypothetical protein MD484_g6878, partial [Candolleomyces efflorescens]